LRERSVTAMKGNEYSLQDGILYKLKKLSIPQDIRVQLMIEAHTSRVVGHFGMIKIVENMQCYVYWPNMHEHVETFVRGCVLCSTRKPINQKIGLYMPLPIPRSPWENISMEFVGGLSMNHKGHDYFFFMVDHLNKMCALIPCMKTISGQEATELFFNHVRVHYGFPTSIIFDRCNMFLGIFFLWKRMDTKLKYSTTFHPHTDGENEVVNQVLVQLLRGYNSKHPKTWVEKLVYIQHSYKQSLHTSTNKNPFDTFIVYLPPLSFKIVYGKQKFEAGINVMN